MVAYPTLKTIGALRSKNTSDRSSRKACKKNGSDKPVHDEGDDATASHQKYMFLVQSHIGQEEGQKTMVDNVSMSTHAQVIQNTTELIAPPTQVTTHTQNSTDIDTKNSYQDENGGKRGDGGGDYSSSSPKNLVLGCASRNVE